MTLRNVLFERPWVLIPALVVIQLILIRIWSNRRTPRTQQLMLVGFLATLVMPVIQTLVITTAEQLRAVCRQVVKAVEQGDVDAFAEHISDRFQADGLDRAAFLRRVEETMVAIKVRNARVRRCDTRAEADQATVELTVLCTIITREELLSSTLTAWRLTFVREDGAWRMTSVEPQPSAQFPVRRLGDVLH